MPVGSAGTIMSIIEGSVVIPSRVRGFVKGINEDRRISHRLSLSAGGACFHTTRIHWNFQSIFTTS